MLVILAQAFQTAPILRHYLTSLSKLQSELKRVTQRNVNTTFFFRPYSCRLQEPAHNA